MDLPTLTTLLWALFLSFVFTCNYLHDHPRPRS
jgi:hypothetical protein